MNNVYIYLKYRDRRVLPLPSLKKHRVFANNTNFHIGSLYDGKRILLDKKNGFNSMGHDNVSADYIKEIIDYKNTNLILILTDNTKRENIRGFVLLYINDFQMELSIICVNKRPNVKTRSNINYGNGSQLINIIKFLGTGFVGGIKTYALDNIIPYYYKFGWRFIVSDQATERSHLIDVYRNLLEFFKRTKHYLKRDKDENELIRLLFPLRGFLEDRANIIRTGEAIGADATELARDNGYQMLLIQ
jgi:hypothetical protein